MWRLRPGARTSAVTPVLALDRPLVQSSDDSVGPGFMGAAEFYRAVPNSDVDVQTINQFAKFLARFEEGNSLRWHFDAGSGFWIASDACSSLARVEPSESADFNLVAGSQGTDDAVKYGANDGVGFLPGHLGGLTNLFSQISPGHLAHPRCITKKGITVFLGAPGCQQLQQGRPLVKWAGTVM